MNSLLCARWNYSEWTWFKVTAMHILRTRRRLYWHFFWCWWCCWHKEKMQIGIQSDRNLFSWTFWYFSWLDSAYMPISIKRGLRWCRPGSQKTRLCQPCSLFCSLTIWAMLIIIIKCTSRVEKTWRRTNIVCARIRVHSNSTEAAAAAQLQQMAEREENCMPPSIISFHFSPISCARATVAHAC